MLCFYVNILFEIGRFYYKKLSSMQCLDPHGKILHGSDSREAKLRRLNYDLQ